MASLLPRLDVPSSYKDNKSQLERAERERTLAKSTTLYVGNLSFYTSEEQIHELFSKCGEVKRIIMGLDRNKKTPCGFCFVEYYTHEDAIDCLKSINGTKLDDRVIRTDIDTGFVEGRQFGRGRNGGQVRDEFRVEYDVGRGGWGHKVAEEKAREAERNQLYENYTTAPKGAQSKYQQTKPAESSKKRSKRDDDEEEGEERADINSRLGNLPNKKSNV